MTAIRGLLERNLLERAVALAETRWPGSGPVVELAHEWAALPPGARRERLASIGPDELARLRGVAQLQPDLARVLDDLEARGIIPPEQAAVPDETVEEPVIEPGTPIEPAPTFEEAVADAAIDYSEQGLQRLARSAQEQLPPQLQAAAGGMDAVAAAEAAAEATVAAAAAEAARLRASFDPVEPVEMPDLDLGLPSTGEFLDQEAERRQQASELANSILERARSRVDESATRLLPVPTEVRPVASVADTLPLLESVPAPPVGTEAPIPAQSTRVDAPVNRGLVSRIEREQVVVIEPSAPLPTAADLQAAAQDTDRDYVALVPDEIGLRAFYGGLVREGSRAEPRAGQFPAAVSKPGVVAVFGRLYPKTIERLREGYCDIPGTQATVLVHPDCRIVIVPR
jgi:hypothetical protein